MITIGPLLIPEENKLLQIQNVKMKINQKYLNSEGVLIVTESALWWKQNDREDSVSIPWIDITVHAVSNLPSKSIYIMMDLNLEWPGVYERGVDHAHSDDMDVTNGHSDNDDSDGNDDNEDDDIDEGHFEDDAQPDLTEIWLIPEDESAVEVIFAKMKDCQNANQDESFSDVDEDEILIAQEIGMMHAVENGRGEMENLNLNDDRFADAEEYVNNNNNNNNS